MSQEDIEKLDAEVDAAYQAFLDARTDEERGAWLAWRAAIDRRTAAREG